MTPDDMEKRLTSRLGVDPDGRPFVVVAREDLRALLLAYQERGRALEDLLALPVAAQSLVYLDKGIGTKTPEAAWLRARATLNLKGKGHG
jgi:hypothetical protein